MNFYNRILSAIDRRINSKIDGRIDARIELYDTYGSTHKTKAKAKAKAQKKPLVVKSTPVKKRTNRGRNCLISLSPTMTPTYRAGTKNALAWSCIKDYLHHYSNEEMFRVDLTRKVMEATGMTYANASTIISQMIAAQYLRSRATAIGGPL